MGYSFAVLGGDPRQQYLADYLLAQGHRLCAGHELSQADTVILPMPALDAEGRIRGTDLTVGDLTDLFDRTPRIYGGILRNLPKKLPNAYDYAQWESLIIANAVLTAEGAIQLALEQMPTSIQGSRFLVIGAGRIGMSLALRLKALGAEVTVTARSSRDFARIRALGLTADETGLYHKGLGQYDCIFNTVPCPILAPAQLESTAETCHLIDLASAPGGFPPGDPRILSGSGLPGKTAPKTAGELIAREILTHLSSLT